MVDEAQRLRARAARYRQFAELSCDGKTRAHRLQSASRFERLADGNATPVAPAAPLAPHGFSPLLVLKRMLGRVAAAG